MALWLRPVEMIEKVNSNSFAVYQDKCIQRTTDATSIPTDARMVERLFFEDIKPDAKWKSPSRTITETDVVNFASMTGDFNPLHVDQEFAESTPYGQRVAHGLLGLSWVAGLASRHPHVNTAAFVGVRNWEFLRPLFFGDTVYVETTILEKTEHGRRAGKVKWNLKLINQRDEVTQQGVFETLVSYRKPIPRPHITRGRQPSTSTEKTDE